MKEEFRGLIRSGYIEDSEDGDAPLGENALGWFIKPDARQQLEKYLQADPKRIQVRDIDNIKHVFKHEFANFKVTDNGLDIYYGGNRVAHFNRYIMVESLDV